MLKGLSMGNDLIVHADLQLASRPAGSAAAAAAGDDLYRRHGLSPAAAEDPLAEAEAEEQEQQQEQQRSAAAAPPVATGRHERPETSAGNGNSHLRVDLLVRDEVVGHEAGHERAGRVGQLALETADDGLGMCRVGSEDLNSHRGGRHVADQDLERNGCVMT